MRMFLEGGKLRAILIKEGISVNRNKWTRAVLEQVAKVSDGVPVHFYDMSKKGDGSLGHHWAALRHTMPPAIRQLLPETLPGSKIGVVRNAVVEDDNKGLAQVVADIEQEENTGWFTSIIESLKARGRSMGLSIFAPERGIKFHNLADGVREPTEVTEVVSFDAVSSPSAGGSLMPALEALGQPVEVDQMKWKNLVRRLRSLVPKGKLKSFDKIKAPDDVDTISGLLEADSKWVDAVLESRGTKVDGDARVPFLEALVSTTVEDPKDDPAPNPGTVKIDPAADPDPKDPAAIEAVTRKEFAALNDVTKNLVKVASFSMLESVIGSAKLTKALGELARSQFTGIIEAEGVIEKSSVEKFVTELKKAVGDSTNPTLESVDIQSTQTGTGEEWMAAFRGMYADQDQWIGEGDKKRLIPRYRSVRRAYCDLTGDVHCDGREFYIKNHGRKATGIMESIDISGTDTYKNFETFGGLVEATLLNSMFTLINSEELHQAVVREYNQMTHDWKLIASTENVTDFKVWHWLRIGEFPNIPVVAEGAAYVEWAGRGPTEEEITLQIEKKGGVFSMTWEMIVNDMTRRLQSYPQKIARAANRTLNDEVFEHVVGNNAIYDTDLLGHIANHVNLIVAAYSFANAKLMRRDMAKQRDIGWTNDAAAAQPGQEHNRVTAKTMIVGSDLYDQVYEDLFSDGIPILTTAGEPGFTVTAAPADPQRLLTNTNAGVPNVLRSKWGISLAPAQQYIDDNDADQYHMVADPNLVDMIKVGFFRGREEPELFVQDMQNVGSFFDNDVITHKVRHIYASVVADYRPFQLGIP